MENTGTSEDSGQRSGNNKPLSDYSDSDVLSEITNANKGKRSVLEKFGIVILSLVIFAGTGLFRSTLTELVILIIVLFVHEAGHLLAMKLLKYSDVNLLFLPFIGAVTSGREQTPYASRKALVSIAGPLPGLLIGLFFFIVYAMTHQQLCFDIALMFLFINAFNLLPFYPLDGGTFFELILFSRHYVIEVVFKVITSLLLIGLVLLIKAWALLLIPLFVLLSLKTSYYVHKAAKGLKPELTYQNIEALTLTEELVGKIRGGLDEKAFGRRTTLKNLASLVDATWQRVFNIPPRPFKTVALLFLYVVSLCFIGAAFVGLAVLPDKGTVYLEKGEYDQAIAEFNKTLEADPNNTATLYNRGIAYQMKGLTDHAESDFNQAFEISPKDVKSYTQRGVAYAVTKQYDKAISDFNKAIEIDPKAPGLYLNRGFAHYFLGEYDQAISDYSKALEIYPDYSEAYDNRGLAYLAKGQVDQAIADHTRAIEIKPKLPGAYNNRGFAYTQKGEYDQAISDFNKSLEANQRDAGAYGHRARAYYFKKEYDKSWEDVKKAKELGFDIPADFLDDLRKASGREK